MRVPPRGRGRLGIPLVFRRDSVPKLPVDSCAPIRSASGVHVPLVVYRGFAAFVPALPSGQSQVLPASSPLDFCSYTPQMKKPPELRRRIGTFLGPSEIS